MAKSYFLRRNYSVSDTEFVELVGPLPHINAVEDDVGDTYDWTRIGYNFIGYNTAQDGSGTMAQPNESAIGATMYAQWQEQVQTPDIDISLGSTSIATLLSSGTVVLATAGTWVEQDITIIYTKQ